MKEWVLWKVLHQNDLQGVPTLVGTGVDIVGGPLPLLAPPRLNGGEFQHNLVIAGGN